MKRYIMILCCILALASCNDPNEGSTYQVYDMNPISMYLEAEEDYSEWVAILKYSDMYNALNQSTQNFTAFVPDNASVQHFYEQKGVSSIEDLGYEYARSLVRHHTVLDTVSVDEFVMLEYMINLSGDKISIEIDSVVAGEAILNDGVRVVEMGVSAYNGVIYYVEGVMIPLVETVYDRIAQNDAYSIMTEAVEATGWKEALQTLSDTIRKEGATTINSRYYTFFAVSNENFAKSGVSNLSDLKTLLGADENVSDTTNALYQYVAYHILSSNYTLANLQTFIGSDTSKILDTQADNQVMMITLDSLSEVPYTINMAGVSAHFVTEKSDILAKNGYLHEVDSYLPVWEPQQTTVVWDLTDYSEVRNIVGDVFQPLSPVTSEGKYSVFDATCYTVELSPSGVGGTSYGYLSYVTCRSNLKKANNYDRLALNIGYMGTLSMKTPTLVRGKYKVSLSLVYLSDHSFMRTMSDGNGGLMKLSFDGEQINNVSPYTKVNSSFVGVYESVIYDEVTFETTASHVFKIVVMDPAASTNSKYSIQLDCITFTPITE